MDVRSIKLRLVARHVRAVVADAEGVRGVDLEGEAASRVFSAGEELCRLCASRGEGDLRALSVDLLGQVVRLSFSDKRTRGVRIDGAHFAELRMAVRAVARQVVTEVRQKRLDPVDVPMDERFWSEVYRQGHDGWELARAAPPIARWLAAHPQAGQRVLVLGCGRGHEARLFARAGANVVAVDIASEAVEAARRLAEAEGVALEVRQADLFRLAADEQRYDLVVEHCCFCAIDVRLRPEYARIVAEVLAPKGRLVGLFWNHGRPGGPPFTVDREELLATFTPHFEPLHWEVPEDSVATRLGDEFLAEFRKKT
jgi:SAM-dependent methyltransferase